MSSFGNKRSTIYRHHRQTARHSVRVSSPRACAGPHILTGSHEEGELVFANLLVKEEMCSVSRVLSEIGLCPSRGQIPGHSG